MHDTESVESPVAARQVDVVEDRISPATRIGQVMVAGSGVVLAVSGVLTLTSTGIHKDLAQPVAEIFGHTHSPMLGIVELVVGILLIGLGTSLVSRGSAIVLGVLLVAAGFFALASPGNTPEELAIDSTYGWIPLVLGVIVTVGSLLPDRIVRVRSRRVERI